jgi:hypothetical protein
MIESLYVWASLVPDQQIEIALEIGWDQSNPTFYDLEWLNTPPIKEYLHFCEFERNCRPMCEAINHDWGDWTLHHPYYSPDYVREPESDEDWDYADLFIFDSFFIGDPTKTRRD